MPWSTVQRRWPNGTPHWTVENEATRSRLTHPDGSLKRFSDHAQAFTQADQLNIKDSQKPRPPVLTGDEDDFDIIEE